MFVTIDQREIVAKTLNAIGLIFFILGIFSELIEFGLAFVLAMFFWMLSGTFKTWLKIDKNTSEIYFQNSSAFSKLLSSLGVLIILYTIFTSNLSFSNGIVIAIILFIIAGVFGESSKSSYRRNNDFKQKQRVIPSKYKKIDTELNDNEPMKKVCNVCGVSALKSDIFCSNCGESI
jgi:hypothetical protein